MEDRDDDTRACRRCCCFTLLLLLVVIVIVVLVVFIVLKPKKPDFSLEDVQIVSFRLDQPPPQTTSGLEVFLSMNLELTLAAHNPNKVGIRYSTSRIFIFYRENLVGLAVVPPFYQPAHSRTRVQATLVVSRVNLLQTDASEILQDSVDGIVRLNLRGKVPAQVTILGIDTPRVQVEIICQIVVNPRQEQLVNKQCGVRNVAF